MKNTKTDSFRVRSYEMDAKGRASVQTICNYLQEIAGEHAAELGVSVQSLFKQNLTWVLSRLHLKIEHYPHWGDQVNIETWPSGAQGLHATREFILTDNAGTQIGVATTSWMILDLIKKRPVVIPEHIDQKLISNQVRAIEDPFDRLPQLARVDHEKQFNVRYSDLDINQHVNNVNYIEWAIEAVPPELYTSGVISGIEISFRAESRYGDRIISQSQVLDGQCLHKLIRDSDQREVAIVRSYWL